MKKGILIGSSIIGLAIFSVAVITQFRVDNSAANYTPREKLVQNDAAAGAAAWLHKLRANQETGEVSPADVLASREMVAKLKTKNSAAVGLEWLNLGPINIGGRTRAILFDRNNPDTIFAGGVSGGLFKTTNGGINWSPINDFQSSLSVVSICMAANGDIYYGTGEGMYASSDGNGNSGTIGGGMFKSTDGGNTFTLLPSTVPTGSGGNAPWSSIGKLAADPVNPQRIYAATNIGLKVSNDGGATWLDGLNFSSAATDMDMTSSGHVYVKQGANLYKSTTGDPGTFVVLSGGTSDLPSCGTRMRVAVSPQDENYVYVVSTKSAGFGRSQFDKAYQSKDGGQTWRVIGQQSSQIDPHNDQGEYNNALAVSPLNKERILVGGVTLWEWSEQNGWLEIASRFESDNNPFYVHADNHEIKFHPEKPNVIFVGNDGGIFRSINDGLTWTNPVKNFVTTQFYKITDGPDGKVSGGTQDNGTILLDPKQGIFGTGSRTPGIMTAGIVRDGDGGFVAMSKLDPSISFKAMQYGIIGRSYDEGESYTYILDDVKIPQTAVNLGSQFASFVTPFALWEKRYDYLSHDSVTFIASNAFRSIGFGNGGTTYNSSMTRPNPDAEFIPDGFTIKTADGLELKSDANGNLVGDGTGTFDPNTGDFNAVFSTGVSLEITAEAKVRYPAGSTITVPSAINELPMTIESIAQPIESGDSIRIQDVAQSMFFVGVTARKGTATGNFEGGIWMSRDALSNPVDLPTMYHIGKLSDGETPESMEVSADGNSLWVGTSSGRLYRYTNLEEARDSASMSIDDYYLGAVIDRPNTSAIKAYSRTFGGGRTVTDIAVHPNDPNKVVVTVGAYGNTQYVFYSDNAMDSIPTFTSAQGNLPTFPVYCAIFNFKSSNPNEVIVGTDQGVFATEDISANSVDWSEANTNMGYVPVFDLVQQRTVRYDLKSGDDYEGKIYAGTHGRGLFETTSATAPIGQKENPVVENSNKLELNIYPNPTSDKCSVKVSIENTTDVMITLRDINGRLVKNFNYKNVGRDVTELSLNVGSLRNGTYVISVHKGSEVSTGKLVILK